MDDDKAGWMDGYGIRNAWSPSHSPRVAVLVAKDREPRCGWASGYMFSTGYVIPLPLV